MQQSFLCLNIHFFPANLVDTLNHLKKCLMGLLKNVTAAPLIHMNVKLSTALVSCTEKSVEGVISWNDVRCMKRLLDEM
jgi:hypothetical protein